LLALLHRWQDEAVRAGRTIMRIAVAFEAGRDGFWLARWACGTWRRGSRDPCLEHDVCRFSSFRITRSRCPRAAGAPETASAAVAPNPSELGVVATARDKDCSVRLGAAMECSTARRRFWVLPDDVPGHPYAVAMETVHLAPNAQVSLYPWKDTPDKIPLAVRHIRTFLRAHRPVTAAHSMATAAQ
jgi:hypothetical protein